jgi:hypothetical protein
MIQSFLPLQTNPPTSAQNNLRRIIPIQVPALAQADQLINQHTAIASATEAEINRLNVTSNDSELFTQESYQDLVASNPPPDFVLVFTPNYRDPVLYLRPSLEGYHWRDPQSREDILPGNVRSVIAEQAARFFASRTTQTQV